MDRDRSRICKIMSDMFDGVDDSGIYPTGEAYDRFEKLVEEARYEAIGWMYTQACVYADEGVDIRKVNMNEIKKQADKDLSE